MFLYLGAIDNNKATFKIEYQLDPEIESLNKFKVMKSISSHIYQYKITGEKTKSL